MTRKAQPGPQGAIKFSLKDGYKVLQKLDVTRLKALITRLFPAAQQIPHGPHAIRINCIVTPVTGHIDNDPSMIVNVQRGYVQCKACNYYNRNILQVLQDAKGLSYRDAMSELVAITGVRIVSEKVEAELEAYEVHTLAMQALLWACAQYGTKLWSPPSEGTDDAKDYDAIAVHAAGPVLDWMFRHRAHKPEYMGQLPYGIMPPKHVVERYVGERLEALAEAEYRRFNLTHLTLERREKVLARVKTILEPVGLEWVNTVAFFNGHGMRTPSRIRLRRPDVNDEKDNNYLTLPGFTEEAPLGYFGLYAPHLGGLTPAEGAAIRLYVVEGENDAITAQERLLEEGYTNYLFVATNGAFNELDELVPAGFDKGYIVSDHPSEARGKGDVWLKGRLMTAGEFEPRVFMGWPELDRLTPGTPKDPDDAIQLGKFQDFKRIVIDEVNKYFVPVDAWALDRVLEAASGIDPEEVREKTAVAVKFGECVRDASQLSQYIDKVCAALGLTPSVVRSLVVRSKDDEQGFIARLVDLYRREFHVLYKEDTMRGGLLLLHHRAADRTVTFAVNDGEAILAALSNVVGDVHEYLSNNVGIPVWLLPQTQTPIMQPIRELQKILSHYVKIALQTIYMGVMAKNECTILGQGVHVIDDPHVPRAKFFYVVNGQACYKGVYLDDVNDDVKWVKLDGPSDGKYLFTREAEPVCAEIQSVADLVEGNAATLEDFANAIGEVEKAIALGWTTLTTDLDARFVAHSLATYSAPHLCPSTTHIEIVGQMSSGKSTMLSLYCGGQYPELQLCGWAKGLLNYSPASIYQGFNASTVALCLDEHTRDLSMTTQKSIQVQNVNELLRQVIFPGGAVVTRGDRDGQTRTMRVRTNVVTSSIFPAHDAQDASRRYTIETVKVHGKKDPATVLAQTIPKERMRSIRKLFTVGTFRFYTNYMAHYKAIERELSSASMQFSYAVDTRFLRNFYAVGAIMAMLGKDWREFVRACAEGRKASMEANANNTLASQLFDTIFRTNAVRVGSSGVSSVSALLANKDSKSLALNGALSGALYQDATGYLIFDWITLLSPNGILHRSEAYNKATPQLLKYQLDQHPNALRPHQYDVKALISWLQGFSVHSHGADISVLDLKKIVADLREHAVARPVEDRPERNNDAPPGFQRNRGSQNGNI